MATSLASILERKRQEQLESQRSSLDTIKRGQLKRNQRAERIAEVEKAEAERQLNPLNTIASGATGLLVSGGNPLAAGVAALSAPKGQKFQPLESVGGGLTTGISTKQLGVGTDPLKTVEALSKPENISKAIPLLRQAGAPESAVKALETYSTNLAKQDVEKAKVEADIKKQKVKSELDMKKKEAEQAASAKQKELDRQLDRELAKKKSIEEQEKESRKLKSEKLKQERKTKSENRRIATKEYNIQLSDIKSKRKRREFIANRNKFIQNQMDMLEKDPVTAVAINKDGTAVELSDGSKISYDEAKRRNLL